MTAGQGKAGDKLSSQRLDVWIHNARFAKTRSLAAALVQRGKIRVNRTRTDKPALSVKPGDVLTLSLGPRVRIVEVLGIGLKRGSASEAVLLYQELTPVADETTPSDRGTRSADAAQSKSQGSRLPGTGRPTKRDRRETDRLKNRFGDV